MVAPAGPAQRESFEAGLTLLAQRYRVVQGLDPAAPHHLCLPYLAGEDAWRADRLNAALNDPQVEAIFCARGGYGAMRILDRLDSEALVQRRVPIVGFSDCTALHLWAACHGVPTVHGPVVTQLARLHPGDLSGLFDLLEGGPLPRMSGLVRVAGGRARGALLGGNLSLLTHMIGTPFLPRLTGCILLLEEVSEAPYRIDRMLTQLTLAGVLGSVAGVVVGRLERCDAPQGIPPRPVRALEVIEERLAGLGLPVVHGAPVGHGDRNVALPMGVMAELDADAGTLEISGQMFAAGNH